MRLPLALICLFVPLAAYAAPVTLSASATLTSDYRFRGLSQSDGNPAIQASLEVDHTSGFYAGLWASSLGGGGANDAAAELDGYLGYRKTKGLLSYDLGAQYYSYPAAVSSAHASYAEPYASLMLTLGTTSAKIGLSLAPKQGLAVRDGLYGYAELNQPLPHTPITVKAHIGHTQSGAGAAADYLDYSLGADYVHKHWTANLSLIGTDISHTVLGPTYADATYANGHTKLVASLTYNF